MENMIYICNKCGTQFREEASGNCPSCCRGEIKGYDKNGAVIANIIDRAGYKVLDCSIPNDTAIDREIAIDIASAHDFMNFEPPQGFTCEIAMQPPINQGGNKRPVAILYKQYSPNMPNWEYALELARDRVRLIEWVYSLPLVKNLIQS